MKVQNDLGFSPFMAADGTAPGGAATMSAPEAQGDTAAPAQAAQAVTEGPSSYFEYDWGDGKVDRYDTEESFREGYRNGVMRHDKFGSEMRRLADERKKHESDRSRFDNEYNEFLRTRRQWDDYNAAYSKLSPAERKVLEQQLRNAGVQNGGDSELAKRLESLEKSISGDKRATALAEQKRKTFEALAAEYEGFDGKSVQAKIDELNSSPEPLRALAILIHQASLGATRPAEMQSRIIDGLKQKREFAQPRGNAPKAPGTQSEIPKSLEEAAEIASKKLGR